MLELPDRKCDINFKARHFCFFRTVLFAHELKTKIRLGDVAHELEKMYWELMEDTKDWVSHDQL